MRMKDWEEGEKKHIQHEASTKSRSTSVYFVLVIIVPDVLNVSQ